MAKSKLTDLNDHLFESIEWLGDREIKGDALQEEIRRAEAKCKVAQQIINNANLILNATKAADGFIDKKSKLHPMLTGNL
jgi:hypothetical protein